MIKFFRKIRHQMIKENRATKYILYAIGEIVLVVIGILIALQINTWNEQNKEDALEQEYYCRLLEDVVHDKENMNDLIKVAEFRLKAANQAVRLLKNKNTNKTDVGKALNSSIMAIVTNVTLNTSAFEDLKSGANLNIIKDKNIIKAINSYIGNVEGLLSIIRVNGDIALNRTSSHEDKFANGWVNATLQSKRFINGMEQDVYDSFQIDTNEDITDKMKHRLLNDAVTYISCNARQIELFNFIKSDIDDLEKILNSKCITTND